MKSELPEEITEGVDTEALEIMEVVMDGIRVRIRDGEDGFGFARGTTEKVRQVLDRILAAGRAEREPSRDPCEVTGRHICGPNDTEEYAKVYAALNLGAQCPHPHRWVTNEPEVWTGRVPHDVFCRDCGVSKPAEPPAPLPAPSEPCPHGVVGHCYDCALIEQVEEPSEPDAAARELAEKIHKDILDRAGIKWEFDPDGTRMTVESLEEILSAWTAAIAAHDQKTRAAALRDAATAMKPFRRERWVLTWLRARADRIERGES